jgi:hypothetical protein
MFCSQNNGFILTTFFATSCPGSPPSVAIATAR